MLVCSRQGSPLLIHARDPWLGGFSFRFASSDKSQDRAGFPCPSTDLYGVPAQTSPTRASRASVQHASTRSDDRCVLRRQRKRPRSLFRSQVQISPMRSRSERHPNPLCRRLISVDPRTPTRRRPFSGCGMQERGKVGANLNRGDPDHTPYPGAHQQNLNSFSRRF